MRCFNGKTNSSGALGPRNVEVISWGKFGILQDLGAMVIAPVLDVSDGRRGPTEAAKKRDWFHDLNPGLVYTC